MDGTNVPNGPIYIEEKATNTVYYMIFGVICLIFVVIIGVLALNKNKISKTATNQNSAVVELSPTPVSLATKTGYMQLQKTVSGQNFKVEVLADSKNIVVVSYDLVFNFDKNKVELTSLKSLLLGYTLITKETENGLIVTGAKNPGSQAEKSLNNEKFITIDFKLKQTGGDVSLIPKIGKRTTKFVDGGMKVYYPDIK